MVGNWKGLVAFITWVDTRWTWGVHREQGADVQICVHYAWKDVCYSQGKFRPHEYLEFWLAIEYCKWTTYCSGTLPLPPHLHCVYLTLFTWQLFPVLLSFSLLFCFHVFVNTNKRGKNGWVCWNDAMLVFDWMQVQIGKAQKIWENITSSDIR